MKYFLNQKEKEKKFEMREEPEEKTSFFEEAMIFFWEVAKVIIISFAIIVPVRYFLIQPFYVKGASMEPNFFDHEYLIVDQITYRFRNPQRGDVVVFRYPRDPSEFFIKRVIGLPGETVVVKNNKVIVYNETHKEGKVLEESYLSLDEENTGNVTEKMEKDEYFLMGDNRSESLDSRIFGPIKRKNVIGKVFFRGWPLHRVGFFVEEKKYE